MPPRICTYAELWPAAARRRPERAGWVCVYVPRGKRPLRRVIGPPGQESEERARALLAELGLRGLWEDDDGRALFGAIADRYLSAGIESHEIASSTRRMYRLHVRALAERWGELRLDQIGRDQLFEWWAERVSTAPRGKRAAGKVSPDTGRRWLSALSAVWSYAAGLGFEAPNPVPAFLALQRARTGTKARRAKVQTANPLEPAERLALERVARERGPDVWLAYLLATDCGLRRGEVFALRRCDLQMGQSEDDPTRLVWVRVNLPDNTDDDGDLAAPPKSGEARAVPMSRRLRAHLRAHFALGPSESPLLDRYSAQAAKRNRGGRGGRAQRGARYFSRSEFPRLCTLAGIQRRVPKDLRDTFASTLLTSGFPAVQIMRWLGHSDGSYTMFRRCYARWMDAAEGGFVYREPARLEAGEVPTDVLARDAAACPLNQAHS